MSTTATTNLSAWRRDGGASKSGSTRPDDIIEVSLLLPSRWASDLMELSRERGQSVGQLIRSMIGRALDDATPAD